MTAEPANDSPWAQLRRRKVVQWGILYAAGAWGFLQGLEYVTDTFHWSGRIQQLATLALLIGLPVALVLAWYHGDRGEQRVSRTELTIITLLFLLGGGIFWRYDHASKDSPDTAAERATAATTATRASTPAADARPSIAVLPFENLSGNAENAYFVSGIRQPPGEPEDRRRRARRKDDTRGQRAARRRPGADQRAVDRRRHRRAPVGRGLQPQGRGRVRGRDGSGKDHRRRAADDAVAR
jgi:hypothetical protein